MFASSQVTFACVLGCGVAVCGAEYTSSAETQRFMVEWQRSGAEVYAWQIEYQGFGSEGTFYSHRMFACHRGMCSYLLAKGKKSQDVSIPAESWKNDAFQQWVLLRNERGWWGKPFDRLVSEFECPAGRRLPRKLESEIVLPALGWWTFPERPGPRSFGEIPCVKPDIIASGKYRLRAEPSICSDRLCAVIEWEGRDRVWMDVARGFLWMKREMFDLETGKLAQRMSMHDPREISPGGVWVPWMIENQRFSTRDVGSSGERESSSAKIEVRQFRINESVDLRLFDVPTYGPGTIRRNGDGSFGQITPGGLEHMDEVSEYVRQSGVFDATIGSENLVSDVNRVSGRIGFVGLLASVFIGCLIVAKFARARRQR